MSKVTRNISRSVRGSKPVKYNVKLFVEELRDLPDWVSEVQLIWNRGQRIKQTAVVKVLKGSAKFQESLEQTTTLYRKSDDTFEQKNYNFRVKAWSEANKDSIISKKVVDISQYISDTKAETPLELTFDGQSEGERVFIVGTIYSEVSQDQTPDMESAVSGLPGPSVPTAPIQANGVIKANIPEEEVVAVEPPAKTPDTAVDLVKGNLQGSVDKIVTTEDYKKKVESLHLEETGKKIGEGVADSAFGEKKANVDEVEVTIGEELSKSIVEENIKSEGVKPIASSLIKGLFPPIEERIESNLQVNFCQAIGKVIFPWCAMGKK